MTLTMLALACAPLAARGPLADSSASGAEPPRPNIVFFLCDDLGSGDIAALGSKDIQTPNIDTLFSRGTRLARHWAGCAVCAPSRCVLMTGMHPGHAVVRSNREVKPEGQAPMPAATVTLAKLLKDSGYTTGGFGKWGLGAPRSTSDPVACGFDVFFGYNCQREAHSFYPDHLWDGRTRVPLDGKTYAADLIAEKQLEFIQANANRPFFLYVPTTVPHLALQVPDDEPSLVHYQEHFGAEKPYLGGKGYVPCARPLATYAAMITRMDREVGRIVKLLDDLGLADDTIFVFSSDNGATWPGIGGGDTGRLRSNGTLRDWKGSPYEGGLRVPTVAVWPGKIPAGRVIEAPNGFEDWLPTLLDLAGLHDTIPPGLDGVSLAAALRGQASAAPDRLLYRELTEALWQTVTDGRWKAIRKAVSRRQPAEARPTEVYDLVADPSESRNVASEHPEVVARLEAILDREHVPDAAWPLPFADVRTAEKKASAGRRKRPNVLFIIVDDQSPFDFRFYNPASTLQAPVIERLAAEGMVFDAADALFTVRRDATKRGGTAESGSAWHGDQVMAYLAERARTTDTDPFCIYFGGQKPGMRSVRTGDWKLIKVESPSGGLHTQLFNLADNPHELLAEHHDVAVARSLPAVPQPQQRNLADLPAHAARRREMEALLLAQMRAHDDPYRFSDQPLESGVP